MVQVIKTSEEFKAAINGSKPVVVDFWATWCGPCKLIGPVFAKMEPKFPDVLFIKVDVEEVEDVAQEYQIRSMPTFMLFKDGEKKGEMVGAVPAKLEALIKQADELK